MSSVGYSVGTGADIAVTTAKTVLAARAGATFGLGLKKVRIGLRGVTASEVPGLLELCYATFATNGTAGTGNTTRTSSIAQAYGRVMASGCTAFSNSTSEPTVLTVIDEFPLTPNGGLVIYDWPLGDDPDAGLQEGFVIRATFAATVNLRASMWFERR